MRNSGRKADGRRIGIMLMAVVAACGIFFGSWGRALCAENDGKTDGKEERKMLSDTVGFFSTRCINFAQLRKNVCMLPGTNVGGGLNGDIGTLIAGFMVMGNLFYGKTDIPQTSWLKVVTIPDVPGIIVSISDGETIYGIGEGRTFRDAITDLVQRVVPPDALSVEKDPPVI